MNHERRVLIYGASGYTGKLVAESLADRHVPFYFVGRNRSKLESALDTVRSRSRNTVDAEIAVADNDVASLMPLFRQVDVVINTCGPFMQLSWPVVEAALEAGCHYIDTTGEQDWTIAVAEKYGEAFAAKNRLLAPATSYMWSAGALAAEVVLENPDIDSLEILYQIDNGLPSDGSTRSFLRMACNPDQFLLQQGRLERWTLALCPVHAPYRLQTLQAHPWGGACEPVWFRDRLRNCKVLTHVAEHLVEPISQALAFFKEKSVGLDRAGCEALTNAIADSMNVAEPPKDDPDVQRSCIIVHGQGRTTTSTYVMNLSAPYRFTGEICAESALRLLSGRQLKTGFQSAAAAFGHRELIRTFGGLGYCSALPC